MMNETQLDFIKTNKEAIGLCIFVRRKKSIKSKKF